MGDVGSRNFTIFPYDGGLHRRVLWYAIDNGDFPKWEFEVQLFDQAFADKFDFDDLDAIKLIRVEILPLRIAGRLVLDRNISNFFAETEQVAFCVLNVVVSGIDFSNDPVYKNAFF